MGTSLTWTADTLKMSAAEVAEVPPAVCTVTSAVPGEPGGCVAVQVLCVHAESLAAVAPKLTVPASRVVPVTVTDVPPVRGPVAGGIGGNLGCGALCGGELSAGAPRAVPATGVASVAPVA